MKIWKKIRVQGLTVVRTLHFYCRGHGFHFWLGNQDSACHTSQLKKTNPSLENVVAGIWFLIFDCLIPVRKEFFLVVLEFYKHQHFSMDWVNNVSDTSVQFSCSVMSISLWPRGLQHTRPPYPSPTPGAYTNSCPLSWWCHPAISSSVIPFYSHLRSFPASGSFQMSQLFASGGQSIGASASASVLPMNIQDWFPLGCTGWTSLQSKGLASIFSDTTVQKHQFFSAWSFTNSHIHTWLLEKP